VDHIYYLKSENYNGDCWTIGGRYNEERLIVYPRQIKTSKTYVQKNALRNYNCDSLCLAHYCVAIADCFLRLKFYKWLITNWYFGGIFYNILWYIYIYIYMHIRTELKYFNLFSETTLSYSEISSLYNELFAIIVKKIVKNCKRMYNGLTRIY